MLIELIYEHGAVKDCSFRFVRSNDKNESYLSKAADETETLTDLTARSAKLGATLKPDGDRVRVV
jgi:hypothetical protein